MNSGDLQQSPHTDLRIRQLLRLLRPGDWWYFLPAPALGALLLGLPGLQLVPALSAAMCLAFAYGANGVADRLHDSQDKNPLAHRQQVPGLYLAVVYVIPVAPVVLALTGLTSLWPLISLVAGLLYSVSPFRLKRFPVLGDMFNLLIFVPFLFSAPDARFTLNSLPWLIWISTQLQLSQMIHCMQDEQEDRERELCNTAIWLGSRSARYGLVVLALVSLAAALAMPGVASKVVLAAGSVLSLALALALSWRSGISIKRLRLIHRLLGMLVLGLLFAIQLLNP